MIDTIRTFSDCPYILGPIAFAISVNDGFQATLTQWITRYISVYLWLPVSDLFSSILARIQVLCCKGYSGAIRPHLRNPIAAIQCTYFYDNRYHRLLHHPHRIKLDYSGGRNGQYEPEY